LSDHANEPWGQKVAGLYHRESRRVKAASR
jgi:hypothetical protein